MDLQCLRFAEESSTQSSRRIGRLRNSHAPVQIVVLLRAARAKSLSRILIAQAREFVASADAVAIPCFGSCLDRHQGHEISSADGYYDCREKFSSDCRVRGIGC